MSTFIVCILSIFGKKISKSQKMLLSADSIPRFARKRASDDLTFYTPPGSPFQGEPPYAAPPVCTECRKGSKMRNTVAGSIQKIFNILGLNFSIKILN